MVFRESALAHHFCEGSGLEIGGSLHNPFGLETLNVDLPGPSRYKNREAELSDGETLPIDIEASADALPILSGSQDFLVSSHVLEHMADPISTLLEWARVLRPGGVLFVIIPHKDRTFDKDRKRTTLDELLAWHEGFEPTCPESGHYSVWITEDFLRLVIYMNDVGMWSMTIEAALDTDDKVGNGFAVVLRKNG